MANLFKQRLTLVLQERGWNIEQLARFLGHPPGTVWGWLNRDTSPRANIQAEIYQKLEITQDNTRLELLITAFGSILLSLEPLLNYVLSDNSDARSQLRSKYGQLLYKFQLGFRALASEDARQKILTEFPDLLKEEEK